MWLPIHRRPSVTEQSVEGPGASRRPTQEDEAAPPARAGLVPRPDRFLRRGVRRSRVVADGTSYPDCHQTCTVRRYAWPGLTRPPPSQTSQRSSRSRPRR
ncbi:conserved hypothetical protein [Mycobacterium tuberculosis]|nr:conserved hypothetical protein [Mycobacterium tuberculosis]